MMRMKFSDADKLSFSSAPIHFNFDTAIITGTCRSGKTTLGNLLGTCKSVENVEEPWTAKLIPLMSGLGLMDEAIGKEMFLSYITELFNEMVLLRRANFRPGDLSCVWAQKNPEEVHLRLTGVSTRTEVKEYATEHSSMLLLNLTEVVPFLQFFFDIMPKTKLIYLLRKGKDVAYDCLEKHWFSDAQLKTPIKALPYQQYEYKGITWHLPWWISQGEEELFISYSEYDRCIYYWCQTEQSGYSTVNRLIKEGSCYHVDYEDLITAPRKILGSAAEFLEVDTTPMTEMAIAKLQLRSHRSCNYSIRDNALKYRYETVYSQLFSS